jgi:hypothetical protein
MRYQWSYQSEDSGLEGTLFLTDRLGPRAIVHIVAAPPGHCMDTGLRIAQALNALEKESVDAALDAAKAAK